MAMKLYVDFASQPCRAVIWFARLNKLDFSPELIKIGKGMARSESFRKINPAGKVPVLEMNDGFTLSESHSIMRYLATTQEAVGPNWYPRDAKRRARVDEYLDWHHLNIRATAGRLVFPAVMMPLMGMDVPSNIEDLVKESTEGLDKALRLLDEKLSKQKYVAGDEVSIADLSCFCELYQLETLPFDYQRYSNLSKWYHGRMQSLEHVKEINEIINRVVERAKSAEIYGKYSGVVDAALNEPRL
eukprot:gb/GECG01004170.1/.p1 GENE.gb/GECG01004170.1/~~gb/GECG01004170.1/.p1  ORF type:complete len:244 (+),score=21.50 gb/GECG01004170.1/:1-732(+)